MTAKLKWCCFFLRTKPSVSSQTRHRRIFPLENLVTPSLIQPIELSSLGLSLVFSWFTVLLSGTFHKSLGLKSREIKVKTCLENKNTESFVARTHLTLQITTLIFSMFLQETIHQMRCFLNTSLVSSYRNLFKFNNLKDLIILLIDISRGPLKSESMRLREET